MMLEETLDGAAISCIFHRTTSQKHRNKEEHPHSCDGMVDCRQFHVSHSQRSTARHSVSAANDRTLLILSNW